MESAAFTTVHADFRLVHRWALTRVDAGDWKPVFGPEAEYVLRQAWNEGLGQRLNHLLCAEEGTSDAEYAQREAVLEKVVSEVRDERMGRWRLLRRTALLALAPIADEPLPTFAPPRPVKRGNWIGSRFFSSTTRTNPSRRSPMRSSCPMGRPVAGTWI